MWQKARHILLFLITEFENAVCFGNLFTRRTGPFNIEPFDIVFWLLINYKFHKIRIQKLIHIITMPSQADKAGNSKDEKVFSSLTTCLRVTM